MTLGMLFVGLYPFNYFPTNRVSWVEDGSGLHFYGRGITLSTGNNAWSNDRTSITLEILLKPERTYYRDIPHILSLCDGSGREVMYLGQWKNSLIIRLMEDSRWIKKVKREIGAGDVLNPEDPVLISLVFSEGTADIYVNGQLVGESGGFDIAEAISNHPIISLVLGNSAIGDSPWQGEISDFSAFSTALNSTTILDRFKQWSSGNTSQTGREFIKYEFEETEDGISKNQAGNSWDLLIPETLTPLRREFLSLPSRQFLHKRSFYKDAVINVVGFIPLGFFLAIFFTGNTFKKHSRTNLFFPVLSGALLSLFIETNQVFLVSRSSSITDLVLNILGAGIGMIIVTAQSPKSNVQGKPGKL